MAIQVIPGNTRTKGILSYLKFLYELGCHTTEQGEGF